MNDERSRLGGPSAALHAGEGARRKTPGPGKSLAISGSTLQGADGWHVCPVAGSGGCADRRENCSGRASSAGRCSSSPIPASAFSPTSRGIRQINPDPSNPASKPIDAYVRLNKDPVIVEGIGKQKMQVQLLKEADAIAWDTAGPATSSSSTTSTGPARLRGKTHRPDHRDRPAQRKGALRRSAPSPR